MNFDEKRSYITSAILPEDHSISRTNVTHSGLPWVLEIGFRFRSKFLIFLLSFSMTASGTQG